MTFANAIKELKAELRFDKDREFPSNSYQCGLEFAIKVLKRLEKEKA